MPAASRPISSARFVANDAWHRHERGEIERRRILRRLCAPRSASASRTPSFSKAGTRSSPAKCPASRARWRAPRNACRSMPSPTPIPPMSRISRQAYADVLGHFREIYLSSTIGLRKPEPKPMIMWSRRSACRRRGLCSSTISPTISKARGRAAYRGARDIVRMTSQRRSPRWEFEELSAVALMPVADALAAILAAPTRCPRKWPRSIPPFIACWRATSRRCAPSRRRRCRRWTAMRCARPTPPISPPG